MVARHTFAVAFMSFVSLVVMLSNVTAQSGYGTTQGGTPAGAAPGAPAGSYSITDIESISIYSGLPTIRIPIVGAGGRGTAGITIPLNISNRPWTVETRFNPNSDLGAVGPHYDHFTTHGWAFGTHPSELTYLPAYFPGLVKTRRAGIDTYSCPYDGNTYYHLTNTRLTFITPDGTEHELIDQNYNGGPQYSQSCPLIGPSRGNVFRSWDGTSMTFIADPSGNILYDITSVTDYLNARPYSMVSGYLILKDGTRYRIDNSLITWIRDRNGNEITFTYSTLANGEVRLIRITDSLNRHVDFAYDVNAGFPYGVCDVITYAGFQGAQRTIRISKTNMGNAIHNDTIATIFTEGHKTAITNYNPTVVSALWLPNDQSYKFKYNRYGEIARIELPIGGAIEYDYAAGKIGGAASGLVGDYNVLNGCCFRVGVYRRLIQRRVLADGYTLTGKTIYSIPTVTGGCGVGSQSCQSVVVKNLDPTQPGEPMISGSKHYFYGDPAGSILNQSPIGLGNWYEGKEYRTDALDTNEAALHITEHVWEQPPLPGGARITESRRTLVDSNQVSRGTFAYDTYNNQTDVYEYDFGAGAPGPLIRRTHTDYLTTNPFQGNVNYATDLNIHIRNLPTYTSVSDGSGVEISKTWFDYDAYGINGLPALQDCPGIVQHDGGFHTGYGARGNLLKITRLATSAPTYVYQHFFYDIAGNVVQKLDGHGTPTMIDFSDRFGAPGNDARSNAGAPELAEGFSYAFPTKVTNALLHTAYTQYDYYLGRAVTTEDVNGVVSSVAYNDALDRPTQSIHARYVVGVGVPDVRRQTTSTYDDTNRVITTTKDLNTFNDNVLIAKSYQDGLSRTWRGAAYEGSTWTIKDTQFDALGRVSQVSNPYRAPDPGSASAPSGLWTETAYDSLGRVVDVETPDGAHVITQYTGNQVTVTDQAGKKRRSVTDALGRLVEVIEDPGGLGHVTSYLYDALGNLRKVTQGAQNRWFAYDSLSRLIRAKNPEQDVNADPNMSYTDPVTSHNGWSMAYKYDENGNLKEKTDARNVKISYDYDALNRNITVDYSDTTTINPDIRRQYDGATNGKGRFWADYAGGFNPTDQVGEHNVIGSYDALGRPSNRHHLFKVNGVWSVAYTVSQFYDLAGNVTTMTYPSLRTVNYTYDNAGRLYSFSGNLGGSQRTYADMIGYNAAGQMIKERFGTNTSLYHNSHYNNRLQLVSTRLGDSATDGFNWSRGAFDFYYGTTAVATGNKFANSTDNNGNLRWQNNYVPLAGGGYVIPQADEYTYDELNRISSFTDRQVDSSGQWISAASQNFIYDQYGNRKVNSASGGVSNYNPNYDTVNNTNRIVGLGYDQAGNITSDVLTGGTMIYDAESRLLTASAGGGGTYTYDASGMRTRRTAGGQETWYVYGVGGELLAEYSANAAPSTPQKEYGYRNGQLLIIAEGGSGGGTSFVKPASQSKSDLIGKISPGAGGASNRIFSADKPIAALGINNGYGSITADSSDSDNAGTPVRGGPRAPAEEYVNAPSANGVGGESLAKHPAGAQPAAPQKEYRNRSGLAIVTPQTSSVVTVYPTAYQTPNGSGSSIDSPSNTGGSASLSITSGSATETCRWYGFPNVSGQIISARLKMNWSASGSVNGTMGGGGGFSLTYTGGSAGASLSNNSQSSSVDFLLPAGQDLTQVQVSMSLSGGAGPNTTFSGNASVSNIRLEVEVADTTAPVITGVSSSAVTHNSATISWTTNENSDSQVEYRTNTGSWQATTLNPALVTTHSQGLSGLAAGTLYYYRVKSRDTAGNLAISGDFSFTTLTGNDAAFVSQSVPATMTAGEAYPVTVTMLNQGITTWTPGQLYRLGSVNPHDNGTWGLGRVDLGAGELVQPGVLKTFTFQVMAPSSPGSYNFQWQMVQDGVEWFGAKTTNMAIQVVPRNDSAEFISQTVPSVMAAGAAYSVSITFRNTGNTTWTAANLYRLGSQNPQDNGTWGLGRVDLGAGELVPPNALKTFTFQVVAPSTPGPYNFQWRMVRDGVIWFGAASTNLVVVTFSLTDTTPPTVASSSPAGGATNVSTGANVTVTFSEAVDAATVNGSTVELRDPSNALVSATVNYNVASLTATLDPTASLAAGVTYTARVRGGGTDPRVKDVAGNALAADVTLSFTTAQNGSGGIKWLVTDHLGSTRMVIDETGSLAGIKRHDFAPFGEGLTAGPGIRSDSNGYSGDSVRQKFDGYERDPETTLDFAQARYYASVQGRFTSVDPLQESAKPENPQSWNRYIFVLNNPLVYIDPTGELWIASGDAGNPYRWVDECPNGGTCYQSVAAVVNVENANNVVVYGSNNAQDINLYAANGYGMIQVTQMSQHHDAQFRTAPQQHPEEYLDATRAAALFNAARDYHDDHPNDAKIVMTAGSAENGRPAVDANGRAIHSSHQLGQNIDMRYMGPNGRPLIGNTAANNADVNRTTDQLDAFANQNAGLGAALTGNPARFGLGPIAEPLRRIHLNHIHLQRNYPRVPQPGRRR